KCELNKFRIYALPGTYIVKVNIDNYNEDIQLKFDDIELTISECRENQIKMYDKNGILYCSKPVCRESCPIPEAAVCIIGHSENINNIESNICKCRPGLEGELCDNKIFIDFSNLFSTYSDYLGCSFNFFFKHNGITLSLLIFNLIISINYEIGNRITIDHSNNKSFLFTVSIDNEMKIKTKEKDSVSQFYQLIDIKSSLKNNKRISYNSFFEPDIKLIEKIKNINSLFFEVVFAYVVFFLVIIFNIIIIFNTSYRTNSKENLNINQSSNGNWFYKCELEKYDLILDLVEILIMVKILFEGIKLNKYENIFKYTRYITYSIIVGIILGPFINV
ncbi:hypothetical protein PIROE2DRAFT_4937, partial [Piromyces sp. E2]